MNAAFIKQSHTIHWNLKLKAMRFNPIYSICGLWPEGVDFQTAYLGSSSVSSLAATRPVNLSGYCMPLPQKGVWSGFLEQTSIAFAQHSHTFTHCSSSNFTVTRCTFIQGEPDTLTLKFQLFSWFWNTAFKHPHISKELKIIMTFHMADISGSRLDVFL